MTSALDALLSHGDYMFRVEQFSAEIASSQSESAYHPRTDIYLECKHVSGDWPSKLLPSQIRIVGANMSAHDRTKDGQLVLGMVRRDSEESIEVGLIAGLDLMPSLLEALNQNLRQVFLKLETATKLQSWDGKDWIPVVSFSLVLGRRRPSEEM
jgi:hypothetical protein